MRAVVGTLLLVTHWHAQADNREGVGMQPFCYILA